MFYGFKRSYVMYYMFYMYPSPVSAGFPAAGKIYHVPAWHWGMKLIQYVERIMHIIRACILFSCDLVNLSRLSDANMSVNLTSLVQR